MNDLTITLSVGRPIGYMGGRTATGLPDSHRPLGRVERVWTQVEVPDVPGGGIVSQDSAPVARAGIVGNV